MRTAITRDVSSSLERCELTYHPPVAIDVERARRQHEDYRRALAQMVSRVWNLPAMEELPDSVFVEDPVLVLDELAIIARPGVESRRPECQAMEKVLRELRPLARIVAPGTLEGGDVCMLDRTLFVGLSTRTNDAGIRQLSEHVQPHGYRVVPVRVQGCLHLKSACTALGPDRVLGHRQGFDSAALVDAGVSLLDVPADEPRAANVLAIESRVLMPAAFPGTRRLLEREGYDVLTVDNSELLKAESGVTCSSIIFESDAPDLR